MVNTKVIAFRLCRRNIDDVWLLAGFPAIRKLPNASHLFNET
jgi:hypothetical protein